MKPCESINNQKGFTLMELLIVIAIMAVLTTVAFSSFRMSKAQIGCKAVYSAMQAAKMRSITTGYEAYVDFDMDGGSVSDNFFTVYLDTDTANSSFGETNNSAGDDEFTESNVPMPDDSNGLKGFALPNGVEFGIPTINGPTEQPPQGSGNAFTSAMLEDGVSSLNNRIKFKSTGTASIAGSVYLWDTNDSLGAGCAVIISPTGIIRKWSWDGTNWD